MQLLPWLVGLLLAMLALVFVLYPLYHRLPLDISQQSSGDMLSVQADHEQAARSALKEVELDYQLSNLAEPDYRSLRERYTRRAYTAMKSRQSHEDQLDALIEQRLREMREMQNDATGEGDDILEEHDNAEE